MELHWASGPREPLEKTFNDWRFPARRHSFPRSLSMIRNRPAQALAARQGVILLVVIALSDAIRGGRHHLCDLRPGRGQLDAGGPAVGNTPARRCRSGDAAGVCSQPADLRYHQPAIGHAELEPGPQHVRQGRQHHPVQRRRPAPECAERYWNLNYATNGDNPDQDGAPNPPYTYPDVNSLFLSAVRPSDGAVLIPSFYRNGPNGAGLLLAGQHGPARKTASPT